MQSKYLYNNQDITIDIMFKIEHIVNIISEQKKIDFDTAFADFTLSNTYKNLQNTQNLLWAESSEFIADEYIKEINNKN
jgi:hypothetical protein